MHSIFLLYLLPHHASEYKHNHIYAFEVSCRDSASSLSTSARITHITTAHPTPNPHWKFPVALYIWTKMQSRCPLCSWWLHSGYQEQSFSIFTSYEKHVWIFVDSDAGSDSGDLRRAWPSHSPSSWWYWGRHWCRTTLRVVRIGQSPSKCSPSW